MEIAQVYRTADVPEEGLEAAGGDLDTASSADEEVTDFVQDDGSAGVDTSQAGADPEEPEAESDPETGEELENFVQNDGFAGSNYTDYEGSDADDSEELETGSDVLPSPAFTEDNPMPVYLVEQEEQEDEFAVYTVSGSPYPGTISTTYLDYFAGIADKLNFKQHYIAFRASQYEYYMAWGEGLEWDGARFRGSALSYCRIYTGSGSSNMTVTFGSDTFYLTPGTGFVYSDLEHFASLTEGGTGAESLTLLFAVGFAVVYSVCHDLFDYVMEHVYRK